MGSSLADRAWSRDSAVYRITGVLSVIGGWFITAGAAFTICFVVYAHHVLWRHIRHVGPYCTCHLLIGAQQHTLQQETEG